ncbi:glycosyl transferase [Sporosarcina sp. NCCP-2716]|uniref:glycosyltransferase n=1 Tax=Sporosarcina sp. NCCP-2716 TaxID=2943679 RepID=UPI00203EF599|nr:glycosyltransferase [Sporosarcina sp. NCCP-2716]GKV70029.1 glycosyl transferase [Sporosarcina sp. NCCP-2716]
MPKAICMISDHGDPLAPLGTSQAGGQNNYVKQLALALDARGHSVDVFTHWNSAETPQYETFGNRCRVIRVAAGNRGFVEKSDMIHLLPSFLNEMLQLQDFSRYDVLHTHYWLSGLLGEKLKKTYSTPWIHTSHSLAVAKEQATGLREPRRLKAEQLILSSADAVIATSLTEKALIQSSVRRSSPIAVIPIGVDSVFSPGSHSMRRPLTFTFAGRLEETKGIFTLLRAFKLLTYSDLLDTPVRLRIIGGDETQVDAVNRQALSPRLQEAVRGIEDRVDFLGCLPQDKLAVHFQDSLAVIVPSYYESFGMVAVEAQACGSPVIASKVGGLGDIVLDKKTGLQTAPGNVKELASSMGFLAKRPDVARQLGRTAAQFAKQNFNWSRIAKKVDKLYEGVAYAAQDTFVSN